MKPIKFLQKHKTAITTIGTFIGLGLTVYYAHKDTVAEIQANEPKPETIKEKVVYFGKHYWRTGLSVGFTVGNVVLTNKSYMSTIAGLTGGIALYAQENEEIKAAVQNVYGTEGREKIEKSINQSHADKLPEYEAEKKHKLPDDSFIIYDPISMTYFKTSKERLFQAEMEINHDFHATWLVPYTYLMKLIGKPIKQDGVNADLGYLGWCLENETQDWNWSFTIDSCAWIRFKYRWDDKRNCSVIYYEVGPEICYDDNGPLY